MDRMNDRTKANLALVVALLGVSFASIFIRWADAEPLAIAGYRMCITALIFLPIAVGRYGDELRSMRRGEWFILVVIGLILGLHFGTWIASVKMTSIASSIILVNMHPLLVLVIAHMLLDEKAKMHHVAGLGIGLVGMGVLVYGDAHSALGDLWGDLLALIGGIASGLYLLGGRRERKRRSIVVYGLMVYGIAGISIMIFSLFAGTHLWPFAAREWGLFILLALVSTIFGHTMFNYALKYVQARIVSMSLLMEPVLTIIFAAILLPEFPPPISLVGGAIILGGIWLTVRK